jgi:hypothetical protein
MGKRSTWTSKDDDQLRALAASGENSAAIAVQLNRTAAFSVQLPVVFLGRPVIGCNDDDAGKGDHGEQQF